MTGVSQSGQAEVRKAVPMPPSAPTPPVLVLGPLLRHVDQVSATVWVEVDRACEVEVLGRRAPTFCVSGHHYALVVVEDLEPGTATPYEVRLDGVPIWPIPGSSLPASRIRTPGRPGAFTIAFGSCRYATNATADASDGIPPDALQAYAERVSGQPERDWPDALVLLGDQVYADELTPVTRTWLARRRGRDVEPDAQVLDFEEYTRLYRESWTEPQVRWLLSTVPSSMIFDDHEMIDDWNTSGAWRREVTAQPWWSGRIGAGLASYWVYQHLGNLSPQDLAENTTWQAVLTLPDEPGAPRDAGPLLRNMAERADTQPATTRWSYVRHWGGARMVMVDSRAGRVLTESGRRMLDDKEFAWVEGELHRAVQEGVDHLIVGTSLPWLLPHAIHSLERWNETLNLRHAGHWGGRLAEKVRQAADLEHWAAFGNSFERLGRALVTLAGGEHGPAPSTALVLSGDVHHAYAAEVIRPSPLAARIHQLTVSPLHNRAPHPIRIGFRIGWSRWAQTFTSILARTARAEPSPLEWEKRAGPFFGNQIGELVLTGRQARFVLSVTDLGQPGLEQVLDMPLSVPERVES